MCLVLFAYRNQPGFRLVLAANRDEFLDRPTVPLGYNYPGEKILAGKDLRGGGTWLGASGDGRLALVTNYRDKARAIDAAPSRGEIVLNYLRAGVPAAEFLADFAEQAPRYSGFNLLVADAEALYHYSNVTGASTRLGPGVYGLSNHLLNTDWPKVRRGRKLLRAALAEGGGVEPERLFALLADRRRPPDEQLPDTGVGRRWERLLSPLFIHGATYGTRSSSVVTVAASGKVEFYERCFSHDEQGVGELATRKFTFDIG